jgi:hypothetical protein
MRKERLCEAGEHTWSALPVTIDPEINADLIRING